jgi:hypothetical protein
MASTVGPSLLPTLLYLLLLSPAPISISIMFFFFVVVGQTNGLATAEEVPAEEPYIFGEAGPFVTW